MTPAELTAQVITTLSGMTASSHDDWAEKATRIIGGAIARAMREGFDDGIEAAATLLEEHAASYGAVHHLSVDKTKVDALCVAAEHIRRLKPPEVNHDAE